MFFAANLKKIVSLFSVTLLLSFLSICIVPQSFAQNSYNSSLNSDVPRNDHTKAQVALIEVSAAIICQLIGVDIITPEKGCLGIDPATKKIGYVQDTPTDGTTGLIGFSTGMIAGLYTPVASTGMYTSYLADNFGVGKKVFAQDENNNQGFNTLSSIQSIWLTSRNIAYFLFTLFFLIIGLGIILRFKVDPRTVMSIQNQIPKVVVAIVLVTFSYAIVGLLVDLMWATTYVGINVLTNSESITITEGGKEVETSVTQVATTNLLSNPLSYVSNLFSDAGGFGAVDGITGIAGDVAFTIGGVISDTVSALIGLNEADDCGRWFILDIGDCVEAGFKGAIKYLVGAVAFLIVVVAIFIALIRVWFSLIRAFVYIIIYTIMGPLMIASGLFPGSSLGFIPWLRAILAHLFVFPATVFIFLLARILAENTPLNDPATTPAGTAFLPPLIANPNAMDNFGTMIAFGLILLAPELLGMVREAFKSKPGNVGKIVQGGFAAGVGPATAVPRKVWSNLNVDDHSKQKLGALADYRQRFTKTITPSYFKGLAAGSRFQDRKDRDARDKANPITPKNTTEGTGTST